jgi:hypothetical protein
VTKLQRGLVAGAIAVLVIGAVAFVLLPRPSHLDEAVQRLDDAHRFTTSAKAGQTVADISTTLRQDGTSCRTKEQRGAKCGALLSAAAFTAVTAVSLLDCTAPDVYDTRIALGKYMRALREFIDRGAKGTAPALPKVITC